MSLNLRLNTELEIRLRQEADRLGLPVEHYAERLLETSPLRATSPETVPTEPAADVAEFDRRLDALLDGFEDVEIPHVSAEFLRRENIYEDQDN